MSLGSRATQAKPEALVILFRANTLSRFLRVTAGPSPHALDFHICGIFIFARVEPDRAPLRNTVLNLSWMRVGVFWQSTTNLKAISTA
jgi:hypothetical protein